MMPGRRKYGYNEKMDVYYERTMGGDVPIPFTSIKMDINRFVVGVQDEMKQVTQQLTSGQISPQEWYDRTAGLMKLSYRATVDAARGTDGQMTDEERNRWIALIIILLLLLNDVALGINEGTINIDNRLIISVLLRAGAARSVFENWRLAEHLADGFIEARRVLGVAEYCKASNDRPGCVDLADKGWIPISQMVPIGGATCRDHCKCTIFYRGKPVPPLPTMGASS
jgi:hypothetical protein